MRLNVKEIWESVKANRAKLDSCPVPHDFVPVPNTKGYIRKVQCSKCSGIIDNVDYHWYKKGLEHGKI